MYEAIKNLMLAGLGAAMVTREKVMALAQEFVEQGRMQAADAERLADEVVEESRRQAGQWRERADQAARAAVAALNLASREEILALAERVAALEAQVAALRSPAPKPADEPEFDGQG